MGVTVRRSGRGLPTRLVDEQAMRDIGLAAQAIIITRAFVKGRGVNDQPHAPYSTKPISILFDSDTAARLKPKGGIPVYERMEGEAPLSRNPLRAAEDEAFRFDRVGRAGRTRREARGRRIVGRRYLVGYAEYKRLSRKTSGAAPVDLTLSGELRRSLQIKRVTELMVVLGLTGRATVYGTFVHRKRPWLGLSPNDRALLHDHVNRALARARDRSRRAA